MNERSSATTLRPRNRRLISHDDEASSSTHVSSDPQQFQTSLSLPSSSSATILPAPTERLSRPKVSGRELHRSRSHDRSVLPPGRLRSQTSASTLGSGLWGASWSSLQGIASNLFNGESFGTSSRDQSPRSSRRPLEATQSRKKAPAQWGPSATGEKHIGHGSREDRMAQLQAKKRETLLAADGYLAPDSLGRYKRRDSEERGNSSAPPTQHENRDALVYVHKVRPSDTLAGVLIKYNCQPIAFRKANRMWPNDSIQVRKVVVLPVDACGVKGRKVLEPDKSLEISGTENSDEDLQTPTNVHHPWDTSAESSKSKETLVSSIPTSPSISVSTPEESPWKHDSWVMIDGFVDAVEIARLSRRSLGFFPPSRRKSMSFSDLDTPSASLDLPRGSPRDNSHRRKESRSSSSSHFVHQLQGPGGVGSLGKGVHNPGPAQDGLNKLFASHLPNAAPRTSFESSTSASSVGIENVVGGAIEGWVRRIATKATARIQSPARGGGHRPEVGDLIELTDSFDTGDDAADAGGGNGETTAVKPAVGTWKDEQERMLREHFPPRGRVFAESTARSGR